MLIKHIYGTGDLVVSGLFYGSVYFCLDCKFDSFSLFKLLTWNTFCCIFRVSPNLFRAMKTVLFFFVLLAGVLVACQPTQQMVAPDEAGIEISSATAEEDSIEYELVVFDTGFDTFLATQPYPKWYYSNDYYRNWNIQYSIEWNIRYQNPWRYGSFYETDIPYDTSVDYGVDFNYQLYQYFQFVEKECGITLLRRRGN